MDEVRPQTEGAKLVVETVGAPTLEATMTVDANAQRQDETERETVLVSQPSSPVSTAAMTVVAGGVPTGPQVRSTNDNTNEIMMMLMKTMEKVCEWIEAQTSATAQRDMQVWK
jgi:hypothetical protein